MSRYLLDTNICIYHFRRVPSVVRFMQEFFIQQGHELLVSVISEAELLSAPALRTEEGLKMKIQSFVHSADEIIEVNREIAQLTGEIRSFLNDEFGRKIKLPDALIASTAITTGATLVSNNDRDFVGISEKFGMKYQNPIADQQDLIRFLK